LLGLGFHLAKKQQGLAIGLCQPQSNNNKSQAGGNQKNIYISSSAAGAKWQETILPHRQFHSGIYIHIFRQIFQGSWQIGLPFSPDFS